MSLSNKTIAHIKFGRYEEEHKMEYDYYTDLIEDIKEAEKWYGFLSHIRFTAFEPTDKQIENMRTVCKLVNMESSTLNGVTLNI